MTLDELDELKRWFDDYTFSFFSTDEGDNRNLGLKREHTYHVCDNITRIARALSIDEGSVLLAEAIALMHDVGRFPQYEEYGTFEDGRSVNHGVFGAETLSRRNVLERLPEHEKSLILQAVMQSVIDRPLPPL